MNAHPYRHAPLLFLSLMAPVAAGAAQTYSERNLFIEAAKGVSGVEQILTFDHLVPYSGSSADIGPSLQVSNVTFSGRFLMASRHPEFTDSGTVLYHFEGGGPLSISFAAGVKALGADWGSVSGAQFASFTATLTLDSGESFSFESPTNPQNTFFGFIVDEPILRLTFSDGGKFNIGGGFFAHGEMIKDIFMVKEVPEPGGLAILGIGGALVIVRGAIRLKPRKGAYPATWIG